MRKGIKFRAYPTEKQKALLQKTFGCTRLIYNKGLDLRINSYKETGRGNYKLTNEMLSSLKKKEEYSFLNEVDSISLQQSLKDLDRAYINFFKGLAEYPKFKLKKDHHNSYRTINQNDNIRIEYQKKDDNHYVSMIKLPKIGWLEIKQSKRIENIHNVTVKQAPSGKYYVIVNTEEKDNPVSNNGGVIGIDLGLSEFYTDSNGNIVENPKYLRKSEKLLKRQQKKLSRMIDSHIVSYKIIGDKRYPIYDKPLAEYSNIQKQRIKVSRIHERIYNQRDDFLHKQSLKLINENQVICIEDLNIEGMNKNHHLAKAINDASWGNFVRILEYKAKQNGNDLIKVPTFFPSSQTCNICGYQNKDVKNLKIRSWDCPICGVHHDRDTNAAINILNKGIEIMNIS